MPEPKTYRINVTLKPPHSTLFIEELTRHRKQELEEHCLNMTSSSELARALIVKALEPGFEPGPTLENIGISIDKQGRGTIRIAKKHIDNIGLEKKDRIDLTITKHKTP